MKHRSVRQALVASLILLVAAPSFAGHDHHRDWRGDDDRWKHRGHRHHHHHRDYGYRAYGDPGCRVEGWYDRAGYYRERQVCREMRVGLPFPPAPAVLLPPVPPAVVLQPPSVVIQPPGIYVR